MSVKVTVRFYAELNFFLPAEKRKQDIAVDVSQGTTAKKLIEDLGIPHTEVDLVLADGCSVSFSYRVRQADRISVYPVFETFDVQTVSRVRPRPLRRTRFVLDVHLGRLAVTLRMLGFDTLYSTSCGDEELARIAESENRILLARDGQLLKRNAVSHGYYVSSRQSMGQVGEVLKRFQLESSIHPFSRCIKCNAAFEPVSIDLVRGKVPPIVHENYRQFWQCPVCKRVYWHGSHWQQMQKRLNALIDRSPGGAIF